MSRKPVNFKGCLFLKKNLGTIGEDFGPCPNEFEATNREDTLLSLSKEICQSQNVQT